VADAIITKSVQEAAPNETLFGGGPTSKRPTNPAKWFHYFDTDLGFTVVWDGLTWRDGAQGPQGDAAQGSIGNQGFRGVQGSAGNSTDGF